MTEYAPVSESKAYSWTWGTSSRGPTILSPSTDGIPIMLVVLRMVLVLVAGLVGNETGLVRPVS
jgi:hypothetical protein